jgi:hypothetical protein
MIVRELIHEACQRSGDGGTCLQDTRSAALHHRGVIVPLIMSSGSLDLSKWIVVNSPNFSEASVASVSSCFLFYNH